MILEMVLDGPPPAFIIMVYILGLMTVTLALLSGQRWLEIKDTNWGIIWGKGRWTITLFGYGLVFFAAGYVTSLLALINIMIGAEKTYLRWFNHRYAGIYA